MTENELILTILTIFILLFISAFLSGSETALTAASHPRIYQLAKQGNKKAKIILYLFSIKDRLLGTILLGNNLVNILMTSIATVVFIDIFNEAGVIYATISITILVVVFSEVLPKTYAFSNANKIALIVAPIIKILTIILTPFTITIEYIVKTILLVFGIKTKIIEQEEIEEKEEELKGAIALHKADDPTDSRHERLMMNSILELDDVNIGDIMCHRSKVEMLDLDDSKEKNLNKIFNSKYSRLPVIRTRNDYTIIGVLKTYDIFKAGIDKNIKFCDIEIDSFIKKPQFVPETTSLLDQLQIFKADNKHFSLVIDEYGAFLGIVTLEDIIQEIVGNISNENKQLGIIKHEKSGYIIDGSVTIRLLNRHFDWQLPDEKAATIAGLLLYEARCIPKEKQVFSFFGFRFKVLKREVNKIISIWVTKI